jgi:hypothetical protein
MGNADNTYRPEYVGPPWMGPPRPGLNPILHEGKIEDCGKCEDSNDLVNLTDDDPVNHPNHYNAHPSGIECIQITEHMGFCLGNAVKYIWRADLKENAIQDLEKARWYLDREIKRRSK